jgi:hypothetical protein
MFRAAGSGAKFRRRGEYDTPVAIFGRFGTADRVKPSEQSSSFLKHEF